MFSIGSNQSSKRWELLSIAGCEGSGLLITFFMAWSPARHFNAGCFEVGHPGDYATFNSYQPSDGTCETCRTSRAHLTSSPRSAPKLVGGAGGVIVALRQRIVDLALRNRLPTIFAYCCLA